MNPLFINREQGNHERTIYIAQTHWLYILLYGVTIFFTMLLPFLFYPFYQFGINTARTFLGDNISLLNIQALIGFLWVFFTASLWIVFFKKWVNHYLDVWVITSERIIDIDQIEFFKRETAVLRYEHIEDIKVLVGGALKTFIDIGDVTIQTAAEHREFTFKNVAYPYYIKSIIESIIRTRYNDEHKNP